MFELESVEATKSLDNLQANEKGKNDAYYKFRKKLNYDCQMLQFLLLISNFFMITKLYRDSQTHFFAYFLIMYCLFQFIACNSFLLSDMRQFGSSL